MSDPALIYKRITELKIQMLDIDNILSGLSLRKRQNTKIERDMLVRKKNSLLKELHQLKQQLRELNLANRKKSPMDQLQKYYRLDDEN